jgi:hypothetical protein
MFGVLPPSVQNLVSDIMFHLWMILVNIPSFIQLCTKVMSFSLNFNLMLNNFSTQKSSVSNLTGRANATLSINILNRMASLIDYLVLIPINKMGPLIENIDTFSKLD